MFCLRISEKAGAIPTAPESPGDTPVWRDERGGVFAHGELRDGVHWLHMPGVASFRLDGEGDTVEAIPNPDAPGDRIRAAYLKTVLPIAVHVRGHEVLHASACRLEDGVVAFCGATGTGKSTLAWECARQGHPLWADDAMVCDVRGSIPGSPRLPFEVRLRERSARHFEGLSADHEVICEPADLEPGDESRAPITALCVLSRTDSPAEAATLERREGATALTAIIPHAYCFDLRDVTRRRMMVRQLLDLVARVPVYELRCPDGLDRLPEIVRVIEGIHAHAC